VCHLCMSEDENLLHTSKHKITHKTHCNESFVTAVAAVACCCCFVAGLKSI
jgi:hypothetical protein